VKFQLQTAVEIDPQRGKSAFTRWWHGARLFWCVYCFDCYNRISQKN